MSELKTGGQIIWESLIHEGVDVVFGLPGGAILPTYDDLYKYDYPIHHVLVTHEQGAAHMADGYARATGKTGVCIATSGPGATNLITGLATAYMDSTPVVAITGQVSTALLGKDGFQEADIRAISMPVTKHNYLITDIKDLPAALKEAFYIARTGRPGPVLVDICKDVQQATMEFTYPTEVYLPGYRPNILAPDPGVIDRVARLINEAQRPVIVAGQGVSMARAEAELRQLAEKANIPVATSLLGIGAIPATHPLSISWGGMHGEAYCNYALQECDVMFAIGARLDDRLTGAFSTFAPKARIIHVDLDPAEMGKNLTIDTPVVADALMTLRALLPKVEPNEHPAWLGQINEWRSESVERDILTQETDELVAPYVMRQLWYATNQGDATIITDVGQHQMWEAQYFNHTKPRSLLTSGGLGTMGYSLPAAIGAQIGNPQEEMWVVAGDGGFQMTMIELSTIMQERLPIKIAIINNGYLGMVRQWQDVFYNKRYVGTPLYNPDFVKIAEAYGIPARAVTSKEDVYQAIRDAQETDGPYLLDFQVEEFTNVYPMVAPGKSNADMIRRGRPVEN
ncbi:MAG TPA: biosynthetic-type acetolactate synthase large subunit [Promineifilum sp.]|nr:biosynthetic-type acetolactate synthase large subunit [Promineifilum sp.]HRO22857.1 biosynthetic-type acetolactate synthase large subunit [Promineifilum sp.]HRO89245.1 biosynthetic-type acetolactate synthase large subunit [Promineifilum sp.]HRQ12307.1 biosynthetic-type acetolactate synthase large subunit [Promineifilum sp.]